jgi:hypothetical protein
MNKELLRNGATTMIGSVPFADPDEAVRFVLGSGVDVPAWPQLPSRAFVEGMIPQCSEGIPFVRIDEAEKRVWCGIPDDRSDALAEFYQNVMDMNVDAFAISEHAAAGLHRFVAHLAKSGAKHVFLKGQVTGPITMAIGLTDQNKQALFYDAEMRDAVLNAIVMKARWQARLLQQYCENLLMFFDEPVLAGFGTSAYLGLKAEHVVEMCNAVSAAIHDEGALAGIHVCSNTDWAVVMSTGIDVLNFDAYSTDCALSLYPEALRGFIGRGGVLAWGIVPTTHEIEDATLDGVVARLRGEFEKLSAKGFTREELKRCSILTPSCGAGMLSVEQCRKVFDLLARTRAVFRAAF